MAKTTTLPTIQIDVETKARATAILESMGLTTSAAVVLFLNQVVADEGLPFRPSTHPTSLTSDSQAGHPPLEHVLDSVMSRYNESFKALAQ